MLMEISKEYFGVENGGRNRPGTNGGRQKSKTTPATPDVWKNPRKGDLLNKIIKSYTEPRIMQTHSDDPEMTARLRGQSFTVRA